MKSYDINDWIAMYAMRFGNYDYSNWKPGEDEFINAMRRKFGTHHLWLSIDGELDDFNYPVAQIILRLGVMKRDGFIPASKISLTDEPETKDE